MPVWKWPKCGRMFAKKNQAHSSLPLAIDQHFAGNGPVLRRIFEMLVAGLRNRILLRIDAVRSSINLVSAFHFGAVRVRRSYPRLGFVDVGAIRDKRIVSRRDVGRGRMFVEVILRSPTDVDDRLLGWLVHTAQVQSLTPTD